MGTDSWEMIFWMFTRLTPHTLIYVIDIGNFPIMVCYVCLKPAAQNPHFPALSVPIG